MEYSRIVAVTGLPGLYEIVSSKTDGALVRSLDDQTTKFISSRVHNLSHLESIEIYTVRDNVNLVDIFKAMQAATTPLPDTKDNKVLKGYFEAVYPEMDFERVYASDMKKMVKWYEVLTKNGIDIKLSEENGEDESGEEPTAAETLEAAGEKVTLPVAEGETPEAAKPKRTRKKKEEE